MKVITLNTAIAAPRERVFDLARSIDAHQATAAQTGENAVAGTTSGLLGLNQEVTWRARHFGVVQHLTVRMTRLERPTHFQDVMIKGAFRSMTHDHFFETMAGGTLMRDRFEFSAPLGILGVLVENLLLVRYMRRFIAERNCTLKRIAESDDWRKHLPAPSAD